MLYLIGNQDVTICYHAIVVRPGTIKVTMPKVPIYICHNMADSSIISIKQRKIKKTPTQSFLMAWTPKRMNAQKFLESAQNVTF